MKLSWFFKKINKMDKLSARFTKKKKDSISEMKEETL